MSVSELARQIRVDHTYVSQIELGKVGPPVATTAIAIARVLESPELLELAKHTLLRNLLLLEMQRNHAYLEMPPRLREELGVSDSEWKEITEMSSRLIPKLLAAKERWDKPSEWKRMSPRKEKAMFPKSSEKNGAASTRSSKSKPGRVR